MKKKTNKVEKQPYEAAIFSPHYVISELRAVRWAKWKSSRTETGIWKNFVHVLVFVLSFIAAFTLCSFAVSGIKAVF